MATGLPEVPQPASVRSAAPDAVSLHGIRFAWPGKREFTITIDTYAVSRGERVLLVGPSGSGKSTLLSLIAGIVTPGAGRIDILGTGMTTLSSAARDRFRAEHFGIIFQMFNLLPYGAAIDNVLLPLSFAPKRRRRANQRTSEHTEARRLLTALGLDESLHDSAAAVLSVGQQQRVAAARALIGSPEIIIADEPTSALDAKRREKFLDLLFAQLSASKTTLIMVSHDETLAPRFDRVSNLPRILTSSAPA